MNDEKADVSSVTILLVDDEESVLEPMAELLEAFGYNVISADSGQKAIDAIKQNNEIDIVVLDVIMPDMDGIQALYQIRYLQPKLPVILASGYNYPDRIDNLEKKPTTTAKGRPVKSGRKVPERLSKRPKQTQLGHATHHS